MKDKIKQRNKQKNYLEKKDNTVTKDDKKKEDSKCLVIF